ncbi:hypothetical protein SNE40_016382 [Patella caerulea]|uniref:C2H2-type domain-containing protein n=1 Tax=Patella caerulea TaxID=87958 RepID=A0AAN8JBT0_PATCE
MLVAEREHISHLLKKSILTLCRETMSQYKLEVDGIVCISLENDTHPIVIKVHEEVGTEPGGSSLWNLKKSDNFLKLEANYSDYSGAQSSELKERLLSNSPKVKDFGASDDDQDDASLTADNLYSFKKINKLDFLSATRSRLNSGYNQRKSKPNKIETNSSEDVGTDSPLLDGTVDKQKYEYDFNDDSALSNLPDDDNSLAIIPEILPSVSRPGVPNTIHAQSAAISHPDGYVCKRCFQILPDTGAFESHNLRVHSLFTCRTCFRGFTARNNLKRHIRLHTGFKPYKCQICNQGFTRKDDLKGHELRHSYKKPFRCSICAKGYTDRSCVRNHMAKEHRVKLLHVCPRCGEGFSSSHEFTEHKKSHPEFSDYQCTSCDFIGINGLMYIKHLLTHQTKVFSCKPCQQSFKDPFDYTNHLKLHRGDESFKAYICCFCGSCQHTYDQFVRHEHSHAQMKNHTCTICSKSFIYPSSLKDHMSTHNRNEDDDSSDYWCTECQTGFPTEDTLEDHILTTHESAKPDIDDSMMDTSDPGLLDPDDDSNEAFPSSAVPQQGEIDELHHPESEELESDVNVLASSYIPFQKPPSIIPRKNRSILPQKIPKNSSGGSPLDRFSPPQSLKNSLQRGPQMKTTELVPCMVLSPFPRNFALSNTSSSYANSSDPDANKELEGKSQGSSNSNSTVTSNDGASSFKYPIKDEPHSYENGGDDSQGNLNISMLKQEQDEEYDVSRDASMDGAENKEVTLEKVHIRSPGFERVVTPSCLYKSHTSFECLECGKSYTDFGQFESHSAILHRRFLCEFCGKVFTAKPNRDRHLRYHTGERPYKCGLCEASFFRGDDLKYHRTTKHATVKPFNCNVCNLSFAWPKDLERHRKQKKHFM